MRSIVTFGSGIAVLGAMLIWPSYQGYIAAGLSLAYLGGIVLGFLMRPKRECFIVEARCTFFDLDLDMFVERQTMAVKLSVVRLWLLFLPTFGALASLIWLYGRTGSLIFDLSTFFDSKYPMGALLFGSKYLVIVVVAIFMAWINERFILRDADLQNAKHVQRQGTDLVYSFQDAEGGYYGARVMEYHFPCPY